MRFRNLAIPGLVVVVGWLAWSQFNMALENDGLRQNAAADRRSIEALLAYAKVASRCDLTPQELAQALGAEQYASEVSSSTRVKVLALQASFTNQRPSELEIVNVGRVPLCNR